METSPVCTREGLGLCRDRSGCCFAAHAAELSVVSPTLLDGIMGCVPAGQLSAHPVRDGAGNVGTWTVFGGVSQQGTHSWATAIGKASKKPDLPSLPPKPNPKPQNQNPEEKQTQVSLPMFSGTQQASNYPNYSTCQGSSRSRTTLLPCTTALSLSHLSGVPHPPPNISPTCPCFPPLPLTLSTDSR